MNKFVEFLKSNFILILIILFSLSLTFYPHLHYKYPLHVDEWIHLTWSKEIMTTGGIPDYDPFLSWYRPYKTFEDGYHIFLSSFFLITGINPVYLSLIFPMFFTLLIVLSVYLLAFQVSNNKSVALIASLIIGTISSDVTFLGHIFAVPLNLGVIFIILVLLLAEKRYYLTISLFIGASFLIYPPAGVIEVIGLVVFYTLKLIYEKPFSIKKATISLLLGILGGLPLILNIAVSSQSIQFNPYFFMVDLIKYFSYPLAVLAIVGIIYKFRQTDSPIFAYIFSLVLFLIPFKFFRFGFLIPYERLIIFFFPVLAIYSAIGISSMVKFLPKFQNFALALIIITIASFAISSNLSDYSNYYYIIDEKEYQFYLSIKEDTPQDAVFLVKPDKAIAFVPVSERKSVVWLSNTEDFSEIFKNVNLYYNNQLNDSEKNIFLTKYNIKYVVRGLEFTNVN